MIPKKIHYCWFGRSELPSDAKNCILSWEKYCKDYEIIEWNEDNFDISSNPYSMEAYNNKMFAFVSDFARLKIIYENGGIYMDVDVEIIKNIDELLNNEAFMGFEHGIGVNSGLIAGSVPKNKLIKDLINIYDEASFLNLDKSLNLKSCVTFLTDALVSKGLILEDKMQKVESLTVYPTEYFCPFNHYNGNLIITNNTYSIHKFAGYWTPEISRAGNKIKWKYQNKLGPKLGLAFGRIIYFFEILNRGDFKFIKNKIYGLFK